MDYGSLHGRSGHDLAHGWSIDCAARAIKPNARVNSEVITMRNEYRASLCVCSLAVLMPFFSGCGDVGRPQYRIVPIASTPQPQPQQAQATYSAPTSRQTYPRWVKEQVNGHSECDAVSDLSVAVIGPHSARISGQICSCKVAVATLEKYHITSGSYRDKRWTDRQVLPWTPTAVKITNPYGPETRLPLDSSGRFNGEVSLSPEYCFSEYKNQMEINPAYHYCNEVLQFDRSVFRVMPQGDWPIRVDQVDEHFAQTVQFPAILTRRGDANAATTFALRYVDSLRSAVHIVFKEQSTRRDVSPQIKVTPIDNQSRGAILDKVKQGLAREFRGDSALVDTAVQSQRVAQKIDAILCSAKEHSGREIDFVALVGATYRVESVHPEYQYFKGTISPPSSSPIAKTVLLVEKGLKVRIQSDSGDEGGTMIDSD